MALILSKRIQTIYPRNVCFGTQLSYDQRMEYGVKEVIYILKVMKFNVAKCF
jgi:hypothetical protein